MERPRLPLSTPGWTRALPFFASAVFFVSAVFLVFAPFPLLYAYFKSGRRWAWGAALTNSVLVLLIAGPVSLGAYLALVVALALGMGEFLSRRHSPERTVAYTLLTMLGSAAVLALAYAQVNDLSPVTGLRDEVARVVKVIGQSVTTGTLKEIQPQMSEPEIEEWKDNLMTEFPSALAVFALVLAWTNLVGLLKRNPGGIRERLGLDASYMRRWKAPESLVWPTIVSGVFLVLDAGWVSDVALNSFKFLMAIYAIQGLSILSFFFDLWNIRGAFRIVGILVGVLLMMPLVLSLGFFDLWFDFRSKFRQS